MKTLLQRRERLLGKAYRLFYDHPVNIVRGEGVWLYDSDGTEANLLLQRIGEVLNDVRNPARRNC